MDNSPAKWIDCQLSKFKMLSAEWYSDDGKTKDHTQEGVGQGYPDATAKKPQNIHQNIQAA